jgi:MSHA biogenesis protein MshI
MTNKIRVNLYLPSMRPIKEKLPLSMMVAVWALALLLVGSVGGYLHLSHTQLNEKLKESTKVLGVSKTALEMLEARHADFKPSPQLMTKLDRLSQELNGKRFLSQHLKGKAVPEKKRYSEVMLDMGRFHDDNLWITKMRFDEEGVFLKGFALNALAVPQWLNKLQESAFFSGKSFALMNMKNDNHNIIAFEINTVAKVELSDDEKMAAIKSLSDGQQ